MRSMTGYSKVVETIDGYEISIEMKSLNSKYLNLSISMPSYLNFCEPELNQLISEEIKRGKVSVKIHIRFIKPPNAVKVNDGLAQAYYKALDEISSKLGIPEPINLDHILKFREIVTFEMDEEEAEVICNHVKGVLLKAIDILIKEREKEGERLKGFLKTLLNEMEERLLKIEERTSDMVSYYKEKIEEGVKNLLPSDIQPDTNVLETAIATLVEKADIKEEIDRLKSHIKRARELLESSEPVGSTLDFLAQEMLREFNTILSKSKLVDISNWAIDGKTIVNSFREQVQNVE
ncbi:MAG: YicC family protein [Thermotogaceae bacterium]|nr:YicC family protein [Thermotogaceae bacterium]